MTKYLSSDEKVTVTLNNAKMYNPFITHLCVLTGLYINAMRKEELSQDFRYSYIQHCVKAQQVNLIRPIC